MSIALNGCKTNRNLLFPIYLLLRLVVSVCSFVRCSSFVVRPCVRVKNGSGSRMRALPDELPPVTREVHGHRSKYHASVLKCEMMLALSSDYKPLSRNVRYFFTTVSCSIVLYLAVTVIRLIFVVKIFSYAENIRKYFT